MKSMALTGIQKIGLIEEADACLRKDSDVLVGMTHMGVCGSDLHYYRTGRIGDNIVEYPFVLGHEGSGIVLETGPGVRGLTKGQKIAIEPAMPCHECDQCKSGRTHTCRRLKFLGNPGQYPGLLSERIVMPSGSCYPVPDTLDNEMAVLAEPLSIAVWAVDLAAANTGFSVGVLGSGPIGMCVIKYCRYLGVERIYCTDKLDYRLEMAVHSGAIWAGNPDTSDIVDGILQEEGEGLDIIFDCCGMQEAMDQAIQLLKPGGKIMIAGIPEFDLWKLPADQVRRKEICFQNVRRQNERLQPAIELISDGSVEVSDLVTHRFDFEDADNAFKLVFNYDDGVMKAIVNYGF